MNGLEFAFGIVLLMTVAGLYWLTLRWFRRPRASSPETERLQAEVETLRERLAVIERITVEKENSLEREFEMLRNR